MSTLPLFFLVSFASTASPGPAVLYVTSQGMLGGMRSGVPAALGVLAADALYIVLSVTGLSAVLAASYELFTIMKWAGAIYLVWLGIRLAKSAFTSGALKAASPAPSDPCRSVVNGFTLHAANPKALLYFGSLVPQFVNPKHSLLPQLVVLAVIHLATAAAVLITYAAVSARLRRSSVSGKAGRMFKLVAGSSLVGAGISMALLRKSSE